MVQLSSSSRRATASLAALIGFGLTAASSVPVPAGAQAAPDITLRWERQLGGTVRESSPGAGDLDGDGRLDVVVGSHDGKLNVLRGTDGTPTPHWPQQTTHAINSSPAVADTTGDGRPEIHIGVGTDATPGGAVYSFAPD
nr:VCBS repeat-containing protein [Actinomycetota bacterium]